MTVQGAERPESNLERARRESGEICPCPNVYPWQGCAGLNWRDRETPDAPECACQSTHADAVECEWPGHAAIDRAIAVATREALERAAIEMVMEGEHRYAAQIRALIPKEEKPHALPALKAYADSCAGEYPLLANDLARLRREAKGGDRG